MAALVVAGFRRYAIYWQATAPGVFTNTAFGIVKVPILFAAGPARCSSVRLLRLRW